MKRHKALQSLSQEHHHGLLLAQLIKAESPDYKNLPNTTNGKKEYTIRFFEENLVPHFKKEEEVLFPCSRGKNVEIEKQIDELIDQHKKIYQLVARLNVSASPETELNELGNLLEVHIRKEERELFRELQLILSEDELSKLESELGSASASCKTY
jgi:iron-sulfur cluster repair protein YtfE (RIC family)